jgi:hypothetical protein
MASHSVLIKKFWKPDGKTVAAANETVLKEWMKAHALSTESGAISTLIHSPAHQSTRAAVAKLLRDHNARR